MQSLPSLQSHPDRDVLIYDGDCRFCTAQVGRLARWDRSGRLAFVSLHDPEVGRRWPDLTHDQLMKEMVLIDKQGQRHAGAKAFRYLSIRLPPLWPTALLMHIPGTSRLWQWLYRYVAKYRYLAGRNNNSCDSGTCDIHFR